MPRRTRPALRTIRELAARHGIDCNLERKPAFTYTQRRRARSSRDREGGRGWRGASACPPSLTRDTGLPFDVLAAMRWDDQAQFHPAKYVKGLAATLPGDGCHVFENSRVTDWDPHRIATDARQRAGEACGHGDPSAARPDRPVLRRELSAHAPGDHGPRRSGRGCPTGMYHQRRDARAIRSAATATTTARPG